MTDAPSPEDRLSWTSVRTEPGPDLGLLQARYDWHEHPVTGHTHRRLVLESADWVNCAALTTEGHVVLVRQFRFGTQQITLEPPGGMVDPGETPLAAAQRELLEETGYGGGTWTSLGAVEPNPAIHSHLCHHFLGRGVERKGDPRPTAGESIEVVLATPEEVIAAVASSQLRHALAISVLARVLPLFPVQGTHQG